MQAGEEYYACAWSLDAAAASPLLLLAGKTGRVAVVSAGAGVLQGCLEGHGSAVNDVAVHPTRPHLVATASRDHSLRLWNLRSRWAGGAGAAVVVHGPQTAHPQKGPAWQPRQGAACCGGAACMPSRMHHAHPPCLQLLRARVPRGRRPPQRGADPQLEAGAAGSAAVGWAAAAVTRLGQQRACLGRHAGLPSTWHGSSWPCHRVLPVRPALSSL
jgi:hypothetical protein